MMPPHELFFCMCEGALNFCFTGGFTDRDSETLFLLRGDKKVFAVPFAFFEPSGTPPNLTIPDFDQLGIIDFGQAIRLGEYEASYTSIMHVYDPDYYTKPL